MNWRNGLNIIRMSVFRQFFLSFMLLIMVPSFIVSAFIYTYVVNQMEQEVEHSTSIMIGEFAEKTDELIGALHNEMITQIAFSDLQRFKRYLNLPRSDLFRIDEIERLTSKLNVLNNNNQVVTLSYLYLVHHNAVISSNGGIFDGDIFFTYFNHYKDLEQNELDQWFRGRKMMEFSVPHEIEQKNVYSDRVTYSNRYVSALMSFPFNMQNPDIYLVVNIEVDKLKNLITIRNSEAIETAIINTEGEVIAHTSANELDGDTLLAAFLSEDGEHKYLQNGERELQLSFTASQYFNWIYVGMADMKQLNKSANRIQQASAGLLLFFLIVGTGISYYLSKKMYTPIREIKEDLQTTQHSQGRELLKGNDFEHIKTISNLIIHQNKSMESLVSGMSPIIHEHFLHKVLHGEYLDQLSVEFYSKEIGLDIRNKRNIAVICIEMSYYDKQLDVLSETDKSFLVTNLKHKIEKAIVTPVWLCQTRSDLLACIVHLQQASNDEEAIQIAQSIQKVLTSQLEFFHSTIAVGKTVDAVWKLHESYRYALMLLTHKKLSPEVEIYADHGELNERLIPDSYLSVDKVNQLFSLYKAGQYVQMVETVHQWLDQAIVKHATADSVKQLSLDILNTWLRAIAADLKHVVSDETHSRLLQRLNRCVMVEDIKIFFSHAADELFAASEENPQFNAFAEIMEYIQQHYAEDLSIEQFAKQLNMSVGHFSRSFKEAVGENYIDYITRCRIEGSKELLLQSDLKIDDIALKVGYLGRNSFIKAFRKFVGITPGKYREAHKEGCDN